MSDHRCCTFGFVRSSEVLNAIPLSRTSAAPLPVPSPATKPAGPTKPAVPLSWTLSNEVLLTSSFFAFQLVRKPAFTKCFPKTADQSSFRTYRSWLLSQGDWFQRSPYPELPHHQGCAVPPCFLMSAGKSVGTR